MSSKEVKEKSQDVVVIAAPGYTALVEIGDKTFSIDEYSPVNLSEIFDRSVLDECMSLKAHLHAGNLVCYDDTQELRVDPNKHRIQKLRQSKAKHIEAQFSQATRGKHANVEIETSTSVDRELREDIGIGVEKSRDKILAKSAQLLEKVSPDEGDSDLKESNRQGQSALSQEQLYAKVTMDVPEEEFEARQAAAKERITQEEANEDRRAAQEIVQHEQGVNDYESV